ncbi:hypothetical protein G7Y89_g7268 [Cudoniella acicularis]|uniref:Uncharacterized protein n=1 Tax=Cudoniella acicularis TaxID=354080 RepID=A0A8H4W247_9HELO|nr:hypothetical protein G7Y89_g7268 [Cudoniella acicularis]
MRWLRRLRVKTKSDKGYSYSAPGAAGQGLRGFFTPSGSLYNLEPLTQEALDWPEVGVAAAAAVHICKMVLVRYVEIGSARGIKSVEFSTLGDVMGHSNHANALDPDRVSLQACRFWHGRARARASCVTGTQTTVTPVAPPIEPTHMADGPHPHVSGFKVLQETDHAQKTCIKQLQEQITCSSLPQSHRYRLAFGCPGSALSDKVVGRTTCS